MDVHLWAQVAHHTAVAARDELAEGGKDGVENVDAVDCQEVAADGAVKEVGVAGAGEPVVLPDAAGGVDVNAVDRAEAAGGDDGLDQ